MEICPFHNNTLPKFKSPNSLNFYFFSETAKTLLKDAITRLDIITGFLNSTQLQPPVLCPLVPQIPDCVCPKQPDLICPPAPLCHDDRMSDLVQQLSLISNQQTSLDQIINKFLDEADYSLITKTMNKIHEDISLLNSLDQSVPIEKRLNSLEKILTQVQMIILQRALSPDVKVSF